MKLGIYLDYYNNSLLDQINLTKDLSLEGKLILRNISGKHFLDCNINTDVLPYLNIKNVLAIDFSEKIIDKDNSQIMTNIKSILSLISITSIIFTIDFTKSVDYNVNYINSLLAFFPNYHFLLRVYANTRGVIIESILNKINNKKRLTVLFDPASLYKNDLSYLTEYRVLKNNISSIILNDISEKERYTLIGYGDLKIVDFYKRLYEDRFQGLLVYEPCLEHVLSFFEPKLKVKNKLIKSIILRREYLFIKSKLNLGKKEKLEMLDVIKNQVQVINKIFNID